GPGLLRLQRRAGTSPRRPAGLDPGRASSVHQGLPGLLRDGAAHLRPRLLRTRPTAPRATVGRALVRLLAAGPAAALLRQGRRREPHAADERRGSGPRLPEVHRHVLPRGWVTDGPGGRHRQGLAGEPGGGGAGRVKGAFWTA